MYGDISKEGIGYEEQVLTFLLLAPYEHDSVDLLDFSVKNVRWEINPKLFNSELLRVPFYIDIDFFLKVGSTYYLFFAKSSRKLAKIAPKRYMYKALATFCTLESRRRMFREEFVYYYVSDFVPWDWIQTIPRLNNGKLAEVLVKSIGCQDKEIQSEIFSEENIAIVKHKTRFLELTQPTINERKAHFGLQFNQKLAEVSYAKRNTDRYVQPRALTPRYNIFFGNEETGRPYTLRKLRIWTGEARKRVIKAAHEFEKSGKLLEVVNGLVHRQEISYKDEDFTEMEALEIITDLLNYIILPEADCKQVSLVITANNYRVIFFRHKEISNLIWQELDIDEGTYDPSKVSILNGIDPKNLIKVGIISFSKGRGIGIAESVLKIRVKDIFQ